MGDFDAITAELGPLADAATLARLHGPLFFSSDRFHCHRTKGSHALRGSMASMSIVGSSRLYIHVPEPKVQQVVLALCTLSRSLVARISACAQTSCVGGIPVKQAEHDFSKKHVPLRLDSFSDLASWANASHLGQQSQPRM